MTLAQVKAQMKQVADQATKMADDPRTTVPAMKALESKMKALADERDTLEGFEVSKKELLAKLEPRGVSWGPDGRTTYDPGGGGRSFGVKALPGRAPSLAFDDGQMRDVFDAVVSGKSFVAESKAVDSTAAPMAGIPQYNLPPVGFRREPTRVLNLIPASATDRAEVDYFSVTTPAGAAAAVAEGGAKPESPLAYAKQVAAVRKIAHFVTLTDETLSDYPAFLAVVQEELLAGLILQENNQLLNGTGVAPNLQGMLGTTGVLVQAKGTDTRGDALMKAITALRTGASFATADGIVMNPADYQSAVLEKDTQGRYIAGDPRSIPSYELWGLPVTVTTQIAAGTALVGAFAEAAEAFIRWAPRIEANSFGSPEWKANETLVRCEERLALTVVRPTALCRVTGL